MSAPAPTELETARTALAAVRQQLATLEAGPGLSQAHAALAAGTALSTAQNQVLDMWKHLQQKEKDFFARLQSLTSTKEASSSEQTASKDSEAAKRAALIAEAVSRKDPSGLNWTSVTCSASSITSCPNTAWKRCPLHPFSCYSSRP